MNANREDLVKALKHLVKIANGKNRSMPILNTVLLRAKDSVLRVIATDLDNTLTFEVSGTGEVTTCIGAKILSTLVRDSQKATPQGVEFGEVKDGRISISVDDLATKISVLDPQDFPNLSGFDDAEWKPVVDLNFVTLKEQKEFMALFDYVALAMSNDTTRSQLCAMRLEEGRMMATDGSRLHIAKLPVLIPSAFSIQSRTVEILSDVLGNNYQRRPGISVSACKIGGDPMIRFAGDGWSLVAKMSDWGFPDVDAVIPPLDDCQYAIRIQSRDVKRALGRVAPLSSEDNVMIKIDETIGILTSDPDIGDAETTVPVAAFEKKPNASLSDEVRIMKVNLNPRYLCEAVGFEDQGCVLRVNAADAPMRLDLDDGRLAIVMPVRR